MTEAFKRATLIRQIRLLLVLFVLLCSAGLSCIAFKHQKLCPARHKYAFKQQQHRLYRLLYLQFAKVSGNSTDKTDETIYTGGSLSSAVAYVEFAPSGSLGGVFFGRYFSDLFNDDLSPRVLRV